MNAEKHYKAILFDLDGTLADTYEIILNCFHHSLHEVVGSCPSDEVLMKKVGQPLAVQMRDFVSDEETVQKLLVSYRKHNDDIHDNLIRLFPGIYRMLQVLCDKGYTLGVVTSKRNDAALHGLRLLGILDFMSVVIGADDTELHKPHPEPVMLACKRLACACDEALFIGDSPYDIEAGKAAGTDTIAVTWGMFDTALLASLNPDLLASKAEDIVMFVDKRA